MSELTKALGVGQATGVPTGTLPITGLAASRTGNKADLGTTAAQAFDGQCAGKRYEITVKIITASRKLAWATTAAGASSPAIKADADGSADEGNIILSDATGGQCERFVISDDQDVWWVASAASTIVQITARQLA